MFASFNSPFWKFSHLPTTGVILSSVRFRHSVCALVPLTQRVVGVLFKIPSFFRSWPDVDEVHWLEPVEVGRISFRILEQLTSFFWFLRGDRNFVH